jgi:hypothetical protein
MQGQHAKNNKWNKKQTSSILISFSLSMPNVCQVSASSFCRFLLFKTQLIFQMKIGLNIGKKLNQKMIGSKVKHFLKKYS